MSSIIIARVIACVWLFLWLFLLASLRCIRGHVRVHVLPCSICSRYNLHNNPARGVSVVYSLLCNSSSAIVFPVGNEWFPRRHAVCLRPFPSLRTLPMPNLTPIRCLNLSPLPLSAGVFLSLLCSSPPVDGLTLQCPCRNNSMSLFISNPINISCSVISSDHSI